MINIDKVYHFVVYFILSYLAFKNYRYGFWGKYTKYEVMLILIILAAFDESHQQFISNRTVSILDLAANLTGLTLGFYALKKELHHDNS